MDEPLVRRLPDRKVRSRQPARYGNLVAAARNARPSTDFHPQRRSLYGGFAGTETQRSQRNVAANPTILSGDILGNDVGGVDDPSELTTLTCPRRVRSRSSTCSTVHAEHAARLLSFSLL